MKNPGTSLRLASRALSVLFACALMAALFQTAHAEDKKTIVVLEIQGGNKKLQEALLNALKDKYIIVPIAKWNAAAKKLNVTGHAPEDVALVAADVKADVVITGQIKQDKESKQWKANIAARNGQSGKPLGKMSYDLKSQKVDADTVAQVEKDVGPAVEKALKGDAPEAVAVVTPPEPAAPTSTEPATLGKEEDPIAKMKKLEEEQKRLNDYQPRPVWYPYIDAGVGFILSGRSFSYNEQPSPSNVGCYDFDHKRFDPNDPSPNPASVFTYGGRLSKCPNYAPSVAGGIHVDVTGYPLAFMHINAIRGLGIGGSFDYVFWPDSATGGSNSVNLATNEFRFEVGLRYHYNILNQRNRPSILASIQYGGHSFAIAKEEKMITYMDENFMSQTTRGLDDHGLPNIFYQYITFGVGARIPYYATDKMYFGGIVNFNFHLVLSYGEIATAFDPNAPAAQNPVAPAGTPACINSDGSQSNALYCTSGYGPISSGYGLRAGATLLEAMFWRGLTIRLQGYYELFNYGFLFGSGGNNNESLPPGDRNINFGARHIAQGASDNYFGGIVQVGWQY